MIQSPKPAALHIQGLFLNQGRNIMATIGISMGSTWLGRAKRIKHAGSTCPDLPKAQVYDFLPLGSHYSITKPFGEGQKERVPILCQPITPPFCIIKTPNLNSFKAVGPYLNCLSFTSGVLSHCHKSFLAAFLLFVAFMMHLKQHLNFRCSTQANEDIPFTGNKTSSLFLQVFIFLWRPGHVKLRLKVCMLFSYQSVFCYKGPNQWT